ncbi:MAG: DUF1236 domain-containing protein [Rhizobiales bacterium]|nr:DUF1236 domain-containing protein [Hyphomicrobiales bacterium]
MKARLLSTVAAATLLFAAGAASAQTTKKDEAPAPAPAVQQKAPAEKMAPAMKPGEQKAGTQKAPETIGQAPKASDADKSRASDKGAMDMDKGAAGKPMDKGPAAKSAADKPMDKGPTAKSAADAKTPSDAKSPTTAQTPAPADSKSSQSTTTEKSGATTGQGAAAGSAKLSTEQRTKITTIIKQQNVQRVEPSKLNISISVGARVPSTVRFYPLPVEVIAIYPEWRGYDYILVGDEILVIDRRTRQIVAILEA